MGMGSRMPASIPSHELARPRHSFPSMSLNLTQDDYQEDDGLSRGKPQYSHLRLRPLLVPYLLLISRPRLLNSAALAQSLAPLSQWLLTLITISKYKNHDHDYGAHVASFPVNQLYTLTTIFQL